MKMLLRIVIPITMILVVIVVGAIYYVGFAPGFADQISGLEDVEFGMMETSVRDLVRIENSKEEENGDMMLKRTGTLSQFGTEFHVFYYLYSDSVYRIQLVTGGKMEKGTCKKQFLDILQGARRKYGEVLSSPTKEDYIVDTVRYDYPTGERIEISSLHFMGTCANEINYSHSVYSR